MDNPLDPEVPRDQHPQGPQQVHDGPGGGDVLQLDIPSFRRKVGDVTLTDSKQAEELGLAVISSLEQNDVKYQVKTKKKFQDLAPYEENIPGFDNLTVLKVALRKNVCPTIYGRDFEYLLPYQAEVAKKIVVHVHDEGHGGVDATHMKARRFAWILFGRKLCESVVKKCFSCQLEKKNRWLNSAWAPPPWQLFTLRPRSPTLKSTLLVLFKPVAKHTRAPAR